MKNRSITDNIKKIIAVVQSIDGKRIWNLNCILSGMDILKAHVEDSSQSVLKMDKSSIFDYVKKIPGNLAKIDQTAATAAGSADPEAAKKKLDDLDKLEKEIEKQKEAIQMDIKDKEKAKTTKEKKVKVSKK